MTSNANVNEHSLPAPATTLYHSQLALALACLGASVVSSSASPALLSASTTGGNGSTIAKTSVKCTYCRAELVGGPGATFELIKRGGRPQLWALCGGGGGGCGWWTRVMVGGSGGGGGGKKRGEAEGDGDQVAQGLGRGTGKAGFECVRKRRRRVTAAPVGRDESVAVPSPALSSGQVGNNLSRGSKPPSAAVSVPVDTVPSPLPDPLTPPLTLDAKAAAARKRTKSSKSNTGTRRGLAQMLEQKRQKEAEESRGGAAGLMDFLQGI